MLSPLPSTPSQRLRTQLRWIVVVAVVCLVLVVLFYVATFHGELSSSQSIWAGFGDYVGGTLTPALAFLSLIALLWTIQLQNDALDVSREELRLSREELARSTQQLQRSAEALQRQNFEATYFQMLRRLNDSVGELSHGPHEGREVLRFISGEILQQLNSRATTDMDTLIRHYEQGHRQYREYLDPYFRLLFHIFTFISRSGLPDEEEIVYANIARAQLTNYELRLLFYNGMTGEGKDGFKPLVERYGILKHLENQDLAAFSKEDQKNEYRRSAFMSASERRQEQSAAQV